MEQAELRRIILQYLEDHHTLSLATVREGRPHAATVFYVNWEFTLYFVSSPTSHHGMDISCNAQVSATIDEDYAQWSLIKGIQLSGTAQPVGGIWEMGRLALSFVKKFPDVANFFKSPQKLTDNIFNKVAGVRFYELVPSRILFINNERGFGNREELNLTVCKV